MSEKIVLIDGHSILNRAFYGLPLLSNSEGIHTNAVYGFINIMTKILEEEKRPDLQRSRVHQRFVTRCTMRTKERERQCRRNCVSRCQ